MNISSLYLHIHIKKVKKKKKENLRSTLATFQVATDKRTNYVEGFLLPAHKGSFYTLCWINGGVVYYYFLSFFFFFQFSITYITCVTGKSKNVILFLLLFYLRYTLNKINKNKFVTCLILFYRK